MIDILVLHICRTYMLLLFVAVDDVWWQKNVRASSTCPVFILFVLLLSFKYQVHKWLLPHILKLSSMGDIVLHLSPLFLMFCGAGISNWTGALEYLMFLKKKWSWVIKGRNFIGNKCSDYTLRRMMHKHNGGTGGTHTII